MVNTKRLPTKAYLLPEIVHITYGLKHPGYMSAKEAQRMDGLEEATAIRLRDDNAERDFTARSYHNKLRWPNARILVDLTSAYQH